MLMGNVAKMHWLNFVSLSDEGEREIDFLITGEFDIPFIYITEAVISEQSRKLK
jgi:hypothetical protein